jgi:hypothetical protein
MTILDMLIQIITDWTRDVFTGILGRRTEEFVTKHVKRMHRRRKVLRRKGALRTGGVKRRT